MFKRHSIFTKNINKGHQRSVSLAHISLLDIWNDKCYCFSKESSLIWALVSCTIALHYIIIIALEDQLDNQKLDTNTHKKCCTEMWVRTLENHLCWKLTSLCSCSGGAQGKAEDLNLFTCPYLSSANDSSRWWNIFITSRTCRGICRYANKSDVDAEDKLLQLFSFCFIFGKSLFLSL